MAFRYFISYNTFNKGTTGYGNGVAHTRTKLNTYDKVWELQRSLPTLYKEPATEYIISNFILLGKFRDEEEDGNS